MQESSTIQGQVIHSLTFKRLAVGMSVVGVVKQINELDLTVCLPNQLTGFVSITEISNRLTEKIQELANDSDEEDQVYCADLGGIT